MHRWIVSQLSTIRESYRQWLNRFSRYFLWRQKYYWLPTCHVPICHQRKQHHSGPWSVFVMLWRPSPTWCQGPVKRQQNGRRKRSTRDFSCPVKVQIESLGAFWLQTKWWPFSYLSNMLHWAQIYRQHKKYGNAFAAPPQGMAKLETVDSDTATTSVK